MLCLDHLTIIAPSLEEGVAHVRECLDLDLPYGRAHPEMGTHNHLLRLNASTYLEVIAVDPTAPEPSGPRWFGFDDPDAVRSDWADGNRLRGWVARTDTIDKLLQNYGDLFGGTIKIGSQSRFSLLPDGRLPLNGALPSVIDRAGLPTRSAAMIDHGAEITEFILEHPSAAEITSLFEKIGIKNAPHVQNGPKLRYVATIDTPGGSKKLF